MPRDPNGNMSLPSGTLVNSGDTVQPSQHNPAFEDVASQITGSLSRDGLGGMRAALGMGGFPINNVGDLNLAAGSDLSIGSLDGGTASVLYNDASSLGIQVAGFDRIYINAQGIVTIGGARNVGNNTTIPGSGNLRAYPSSLGGIAFSTYEVQNYTALQCVRDISGIATQVGSITCTDTGTSFNTTSDERLKENIADARDPGAMIDAIRVVEYDFKTGGHVRWGVVAQELHSIFPEAVTPGTGEMPWSWDASKTIAMLIKEVQSLRVRLAAGGL